MRGITRREVLQGAAACAAAALAPCMAEAAPATKRSRVKIGIVDWDLGPANDPEALAKAAKLGFDGVQVDLGDVEPMKDPARRKLFLSLARQHRIEIASLALGKLNSVPYASDPAAQELVDAAINIVKAMKQKVLLLAFFGKGDLNRPENRQDTLIQRLREIAPKAEKAGVALGLEAEISVERYREIVDRVGSPAVKVYFDLVHAHTPGRDFYREITSLKGRICEFHAKDYGNILFGQGKVDFPAVRRAMDAIGYHGWIQVEQWGEIQGTKPLGFDATERRNLAYLRKTISRE